MTGSRLSRRSCWWWRVAWEPRPRQGSGTRGLALADPTAGTSAGAAPAESMAWLADAAETRLMGADGQPIVGLPTGTRMRLVRTLADGSFEVWVPRYGLYGAVVPTTVAADRGALGPGPVRGAERGSTTPGGVGLPGRVAGPSNLRSWPTVHGDTRLRTMPHNTPLRVLDAVQGDAGDEWYSVNVLDPTATRTVATGFVLASLVRVPRMREQTVSPDRGDDRGRHFQADLRRAGAADRVRERRPRSGRP